MEYRAAYSSLTDALDSLSDAMHSCELLQAQCYQLPVISSDEESERELLRKKARDEGQRLVFDEPVSTYLLEGQSAYFQSLRHFKKLDALEDQSTRYTVKLPGFVHVQTDNAQQLVDCVTNVNTAKQDFFQAVHDCAKSPDHRWEIIHAAFPMLILEQAYRKLTVINEPVYSLRFHFYRKHSSRNYTKQELLDKLGRSIEFGHYGMNQARFVEQVQQEKAEVEACDEKQLFVQRRPLPVNQHVKIKSLAIGNDNRREELHSGVAHSPVILINGHQDMKITPLTKYKPKVLESDSPKPIVQRLFIFKR